MKIRWANFPNYKIRHNSDLLPLMIHKPMMYPKGAKFQYNNSGYVLLAMIMEKVTGLYFDAYLKTNIFDMCGRGIYHGEGYCELLDRFIGRKIDFKGIGIRYA